MSFANLGLSKEALRAVKALGFENPTPIQEEAIPNILEGSDIIAAASTGTGKTAAFLLPTVSSLPKLAKNGRAPRMLVITPTRELAEQISFPSYKIARSCGQFVVTVFGGAPYSVQIRNLRKGCDILVATPGRLCDLIERGVCDLSNIEVLVLDEADRMLDMGFLPDVRKIVSQTPKDRQTLLFSATIDAGIRNNFDSLLNNPEIIQIASRGQTSDLVDQFIIPIAQKEKNELLKCLLDEKDADKVIVFARTKNRVCQVCEMLEAADYKVVSIHSDKTQGQRRHALMQFRQGKAKIIVATDVLARGIDVPEVDYVVNYDLLDMAEDYIHRIGRTGRAGEEGFAVSFVSNNSTKALYAIEKLIGKTIPVMRMNTFDIDMSHLGKSRKGNQKNNRMAKRGNNKNQYPNKSANRKKDKLKGEKEQGSKKQSNSKSKSAIHKSASYDYKGYGDLRKGKKRKSEKVKSEKLKSEKRPGWKSGRKK